MSEAGQNTNQMPTSHSGMNERSEGHERVLNSVQNEAPEGVAGVELQVKRIQDKLQQLLRQRESLLKENGKLKEEIRQLQQIQHGHSDKLEQLQQQVEILRTTKGEMSEAEKRVLEKRLGQYIREIDRCIALLSE